ncbi:hypothetical protein ACC771_23820, partial [Rhizobium ruizarguesonis]
SEEKDGRIMRAYLAIVKAAMNRRKTTVAVTAIVVALSLATIPLLKSGFLPASDDARAQITLTMQPGATIEQTDATTTKAA